VGWTVSYPQGHLADARIPVCLVLHGYDSNNRYAFDELNMQLAQAQLIEGNPIRPIALASIDGGNTYWHPRSDGDDPIKMVFEEYLPMLERRGLDTSRIGVLGWSMGGYGALLFGELHPQIVAVVALSPAIWPSYATAHNVDLGAFDSDADWQRNNVIAHIASLPTGAVRVDCGRSDPFLPASQALDKLLQPPDAVALSPGGHDATFWANATPSAIRFLGSHLG
jgi:S-formylglutathione hydrolase FrmB